MSDRNNNDAFDLLNSEFANHELEKENARNLENLRKRQEIQRQHQAAQLEEDDRYDEEDSESEGHGCVGTALRIILILILAAAIAWLIFMPQGSLNELWNKITPSFDSAVSWVTGLFDGSNMGLIPDAADHSAPSDGSGWAAAQTDNNTGEDVPPASDISENTENDDPGAVQNTDISDSTYSITVYRPSQIVIIYDSAGSPVKVFSCSSGKASTPTKLGEYGIRAKYRWRFMVGNCYTQYASSFSSGYLFHSIPYNKKNAGTMSDSSYDKLGNPASSGCIRLCFRDSKWIYDNCPIGTKVSVVDEKAPAGSVPEIIPERIKDAAHNGWDPTDDSPDSPYNQ